MLVTKLLFFLNLIIVSLFAFTIKTGFLENFLSKIGKPQSEKISQKFGKEKKDKIEYWVNKQVCLY